MKDKNHLRHLIFALFAGVFLIGSPAYAAKPIAKITSFKGDVIIQSGTQFFKVTQIGQALNEGDRIQTKQGEAEVTFNDGALMSVRPFTNASILEGDEKSGFWIFKTKKPVRRITLFVGKLRFKSGASKRKNYL
jgi:hypothetical protein